MTGKTQELKRLLTCPPKATKRIRDIQNRKGRLFRWILPVSNAESRRRMRQYMHFSHVQTGIMRRARGR